MSETTKQFKKQLPRNALIAALSFVTYSLPAVWLTPYLVRHLGVAAYGPLPLSSVFTQYAYFFTTAQPSRGETSSAMKESTRIIINTLATYGGSLVGLVVGLFSARWILLALGQTDFGLYGVIGSIVIMMSFLNQGMSVGVARFYAYSIGRGHNLSSEESL